MFIAGRAVCDVHTAQHKREERANAANKPQAAATVRRLGSVSCCGLVVTAWLGDRRDDPSSPSYRPCDVSPFALEIPLKVDPTENLRPTEPAPQPPPGRGSLGAVCGLSDSRLSGGIRAGGLNTGCRGEIV